MDTREAAERWRDVWARGWRERRELADHFRIARPDIKVIYTSGYPKDIIAHRGVVHSDISYIPKPYTADQIAAKVRAAIKTEREQG